VSCRCRKTRLQEKVITPSYFVSNRALAVGSISGVTTAMSVSAISDTVSAYFTRSIL